MKFFESNSSKIMLKCIIFILFTFLTLGMFLTNSLKNNYYEFKEKEFTNLGTKISKMIQKSIYDGDYEETVSFLNKSKVFFQSNVLIVGRSELLELTEKSDLQNLKLNKEEMQLLFQKNIVKKRIFYKELNEPALFVTSPVIHNEKLVGGVIVYATFNEINSTLTNVKKIIFYATIIVIILTGFLMFCSFYNKRHNN